jgi:hypothetical protein
MKPGWLVFSAAGTAALVALASVEREAPPGDSAAARAPVQARATETERARDAERATALDASAAFGSRQMPKVRDAFAAQSWAPPPPKATAPPPPAKPVAPALPFVYLGRMEDAGAPSVILRRGKDVLVARERANIDGQYRLESIGPQGLVITYLPLSEQQILPYAK